MKKLLVVMLLAFLCQAGAVSFAQTQYGTVSGQIEDPSGALVPDAVITLTNTDSGLTQTSTSNDAGIYVLPNVEAGPYEITVEAAGFKKSIQEFIMTVADRHIIDVHLEIGSINELLVVKSAPAYVNTATGDISTVLYNQDIQLLPLLDRDPYKLISLVPAAVNTAASAGDPYGVGLAVAGARNRSINFMLDGGENNETFLAGVGQSVPQDALAEFRVMSNNMSAEFGRNPVNANVVTKSGGNEYHGSLYEFYRGSGLSAWNYDDKAKDATKSKFVRNQFGGSFGGPIKKDSTFFFGSFESIIVRSSTSKHFYVPTQQFIDAAAPNAQEFIEGFGPVPVGDPDDVITAAQIAQNIDGIMMQYGIDQLFDYNTGLPIPDNTPLFSRVTVKDPQDAGGGDAQDTYLFTARFDHTLNPGTRLFGRMAFQQSSYPLGTVSISPFTAFNTLEKQRNQNFTLSLTHDLSPAMYSETRAVYNRILENQPLGEAPQNTPCWDYYWDTPDSPIVFPGYLPENCSAFAIPAKGAQNVYQAYEGMLYSHGIHTMKWGGQYVHIRDNRTYGAGLSGYFPTLTMQGMLDGLVDAMQLAIDTKGKVPGDLYEPATDGPFGPPNATRHHRYNEFALYFEDDIRVSRQLTLTLGLRWEYFGVLHSPDYEKNLDSNLYLDTADASIYEQVRDATFKSGVDLYNQDLNNFAPRFGFAFDPTGSGNTVLRGGYGIFYNRNFGNDLFNVMLNFPNYSILQMELYGSLGGPQVPIALNQYDSLNALFDGGALPLEGSARMLDKNLRTAYTAQWNLTLEHNILGKGIIGSLSYLGANGYHLYSLNNLNQDGSCVLAPDINPLCDPGGIIESRLNQTGLSSTNRRDNEGFSRYHAMVLEMRAPQIGSTGINLEGNYTWAHSIDNASSALQSTAFEAQFGYGFRDPYNTALDRASSDNDVRHQLSISGMWALPFAKSTAGLKNRLLDGWTLSGIFHAQTGTAFSVYDTSESQCSYSMGNFCYPVYVDKVPEKTETAGPGPNTFVLYDNLGSSFTSQGDYCSDEFGMVDLACTAQLENLQANLLSPRNLFRTPGLWNFDLAVVKEFALPKDGVKLRFNADFLNVLNHANLYAIPGTNQFGGSSSTVLARRGVDSNGAKEQRNIQLALRLLF